MRFPEGSSESSKKHKSWEFSTPNTYDTIPIVRDLLDLVHHVILIECIFRSGNPGGSGFWVKGSSWVTERTKGSVSSNREQRWTDPDTARRVPSK
jgi:hypothetical protein